ncbi:hypothetical protein [Pseudorhodobacter sp. MZDSW-24AT]|uniref:hypothetical protein n=1 Tax=Pseudorhodobacter sp. MZDSW-24AT TaxID=2052957 RepID=UPI000C1E857D|nr:hypothetical protein [Pseudorhodobacter sp. MZDSW-24AT]PJF10380.1 hypothetical protein CUR21_05125 [Pseudorhodobacter sp. MZDSW-24AT]
MDYGKSGNPKLSKDQSRQKDPSAQPGKALKAKAPTKIPNKRPSKEELLAQMKAKASGKAEG